MPLVDRALGPFRGAIEFPTHGVKHCQPGGSSATSPLWSFSINASARLVAPERTSSAASCPTVGLAHGVNAYARSVNESASSNRPCCAQIAPSVSEGQREVLVDLQDLPQFGFRVLQPAGVSKTDRQMVAVQEIQRIQFKAPRHRFHGLHHATDRQQVMVAVPEANVA